MDSSFGLEAITFGFDESDWAQFMGEEARDELNPACTSLPLSESANVPEAAEGKSTTTTPSNYGPELVMSEQRENAAVMEKRSVVMVPRHRISVFNPTGTILTAETAAIKQYRTVAEQKEASLPDLGRYMVKKNMSKVKRKAHAYWLHTKRQNVPVAVLQQLAPTAPARLQREGRMVRPHPYANGHRQLGERDAVHQSADTPSFCYWPSQTATADHTAFYQYAGPNLVTHPLGWYQHMPPGMPPVAWTYQDPPNAVSAPPNLEFAFNDVGMQ